MHYQLNVVQYQMIVYCRRVAPPEFTESPPTPPPDCLRDTLTLRERGSRITRSTTPLRFVCLPFLGFAIFPFLLQ